MRKEFKDIPDTHFFGEWLDYLGWTKTPAWGVLQKLDDISAVLVYRDNDNKDGYGVQFLISEGVYRYYGSELPSPQDI